MPPTPKHPSTRRRTNRVAGARRLAVVHEVETPELPPLAEGESWHSMTMAWWADVWSSPMAPEYDSSDLHGLLLLARLVDAAWNASSPTGLKDVMAEIRLQRQCFGLSPIDRRRLQWEIDRGEEAESKTRKRRSSVSPKPAGKGEDPRRLLA